MKLLISLVLALTVQGEVFLPASESSTTPEIAEKSAKGEDEENHLHDLIEQTQKMKLDLTDPMVDPMVDLMEHGWHQLALYRKLSTCESLGRPIEALGSWKVLKPLGDGNGWSV